jgi:hypothetical protein
MPNLIKLEEKLLAHDLQGTDLPGILFLRKEYLTISALPDLGQDLEVTLPKPNATLSEVGTFPSSIFLPHRVVDFCRRIRRRRILIMEETESIMSRANIGQKVEIIVQEVFLN